MSVKGGLLQAAEIPLYYTTIPLYFTTVKFHYITVWGAHPYSITFVSAAQAAASPGFSHLWAPCCHQGSVVQNTVQILNKKILLVPRANSRTGKIDKGRRKKFIIPVFFVEAEPQRGECVLRANLLCQWYNQHAFLVYLYILGGLDAFVIPSVNRTGSQPCICSDVTTSSKPNPSPTPTNATPPVTVRKPAKWNLKHTSDI